MLSVFSSVSYPFFVIKQMVAMDFVLDNIAVLFQLHFVQFSIWKGLYY